MAVAAVGLSAKSVSFNVAGKQSLRWESGNLRPSQCCQCRYCVRGHMHKLFTCGWIPGNYAGTVTATVTTVNALLGLPTKLPVTISGTVLINNITGSTQATAAISVTVAIFSGAVRLSTIKHALEPAPWNKMLLARVNAISHS